MYNPNITPYTPGNIDDTTRMLIGLKQKGQLQQYVQQHSQDPNLVALALYVNNLDNAARGAQAMQAQQQQQPTVLEEKLAQMAPQQLPEDVGIGALPAPNMDSFADGGIVGYAEGGMGPNPASGPAGRLAYDNEPVLRMADGGIVAFDKGGTARTDKVQEFATKYRGLAEQVGAELGVSPGIIIAQWGHESDWGRKPVGKYNFGNIKDTTGRGPKAYDSQEKSRSSYRSYETPEQFAQDYTSLIKRNFPNAVGAGNDVGAFSAGLSKGKYGAYATDEKYGEKLGRAVTSVVPSAQAAVAPPPAQDAGIAAIPRGDGVPVYDPQRAEELRKRQAATPATPRERQAGMWESIKDYYQSPTTWEGVKRNIENTLNALGGWSSPISMAGKGVGQASKGLEATEEMARKAAELKGAAVGPRAVPAVRAVEELTPEARAAREALMREQVARNAAADAAAARNAEQAVKAADETAAAARAMEESIAAVPRTAATRSTQLSTGARGMSAANAMSGAAGLPALAAAAEDMGDDQYNPDVKQGLTQAERARIEGALTSKPAAQAAPAAQQGGQDGWSSLFNDPMFLMGMRLLANDSPYLSKAIGNAGIGTASDLMAIKKGQLEERKALREEKESEGLVPYREALAEKARQEAAYLERGAKDRNMQLEAEKLVQDRMEKWLAGPGKLAMLTDPNAQAKQESLVRQSIYAQLGLTPTMVSGGAGMPTVSARQQALISKYAPS